MKLSTKSTYGLRAMVNLALKYDEGAISISDIAKKEDISVSYLEQLLNRLRHKGMLESVRGPNGGYVLAKRPKKITVGDIVRVLEGDTAPVYCVTNQARLKRSCRRSTTCVAKGVWEKLADAIDRVLDSVNLEDLARQAGDEVGHEKDISR